MNIKAFVDMFMRLFLRRVVNRGIDAGIDMFARRGRRQADTTPAEEEQLRQSEQARARRAGETAHKARESAKLLRRLLRFR